MYYINVACIDGKCTDPLTLYDCGPGYCNHGSCGFDNHYLEQDFFTCQCYDDLITNVITDIYPDYYDEPYHKVPINEVTTDYDETFSTVDYNITVETGMCYIRYTFLEIFDINKRFYSLYFWGSDPLINSF